MQRLTLTFVSRKLALVLLLGVAMLALLQGAFEAVQGAQPPSATFGLIALAIAFGVLAAAVWRQRLSMVSAQRWGVLVLFTWGLSSAAALWRQLPADAIHAQTLAAGTAWVLCLQFVLFMCLQPLAAAGLSLAMAALYVSLPWLVGVPASLAQPLTPLLANLALVQLVFIGMLYGTARQLLHLAAAVSRGAMPLDGRSLSVRDLVSRREAELQSLLEQAQQAHRTASQHEAELRAMLDAFPGVVWRLEPSGVFSYANPHAARMLGLRPEELVGQPVRDWLGMDAVQTSWLRSQQSAADPMTAPFEARFTALDGSVHELLMTQFVVPSVDGQAPRLYQVGVDISARKRAEQALVQAKAEAESANLAKSRFMSRMSHELRTPLNAVVGLAQLLRAPSAPDPAPDADHGSAKGLACERGRLDDARGQQLRTIADAGKELLALVDETMDLSRMDAGEMRVACQAVNVLELVHATLHSVAAMAQEQGVRLAPAPLRRPVQREPWVQADPVRLRQVLLNLLSNAIKYNRAGGGVAVRVVPHGSEIQLVVQDTGPGLTPAQQAQLFQPYNRLGAEASAVPGSGVGLSIARGLVTLMGGRLEARSSLGVGSEFAVWLPSTTAPRAQPQEDPGSDFAALQLNHELSGRVLYVEDNEVNVLVFEACLARRPGLELVVAGNGAAALEMARQQRFDLVVLDMNLPDRSGLDLAAALRQCPARHSLAEVPMVLFTADATPEVESRAHALGMARVWHKPFDTVRLLSDVDQLLEPALV